MCGPKIAPELQEALDTAEAYSGFDVAYTRTEIKDGKEYTYVTFKRDAEDGRGPGQISAPRP